MLSNAFAYPSSNNNSFHHLATSFGSFRKTPQPYALGKFLSLILRHRPETIGIKLDEHGYANVDELLKGINKSGRQIDLNTLERIAILCHSFGINY